MPRKPASRKRRGRVPRKVTHLERIACYEQMEAGKGETFDTQVDIYVIHFRTRMADTGGISDKAAIDGCVHRGILSDDSAKYIREIREGQIKVKNESEEKTILIFAPIKE